MSPEDRMLALLREERSAAIRADIAALERIQIEKRAVLDEMTAAPREGSDETIAQIQSQARANTRLLRQLADLHRAINPGSEPTYTANGRMQALAPASTSGRFRRPL